MKRMAVITMGLLLLFVVVCPLAPTPTALTYGKAQPVHITLVAIAVLAFVSLPRLEHFLSGISSDRVTPTSSDLLDLTCARLC